MVEVALGKNVFEARHIDSSVCELCAVSGECSCRYQVCGLVLLSQKDISVEFCCSVGEEPSSVPASCVGHQLVSLGLG